MGDRARGLYNKFRVERVDGKQKKHANCDYFVLDVTHDPHAIPALLAYAMLIISHPISEAHSEIISLILSPIL